MGQIISIWIGMFFLLAIIIYLAIQVYEIEIESDTEIEVEPDIIEKLVLGTKAETQEEVVGSALAFLEWAVAERKSGRAITSVDEEKGVGKEVSLGIFKEKGK